MAEIRWTQGSKKRAARRVKAVLLSNDRGDKVLPPSAITDSHPDRHHDDATDAPPSPAAAAKDAREERMEIHADAAAAPPKTAPSIGTIAGRAAPWLAALGLVLMTAAAPCRQASAQTAQAKPILPGPLAKLDIEPAKILSHTGKPQGTLTIAQHFALDPGWLDPVEHSYSGTQQAYDYFVQDALIKAMPQGVATYSLAEHAEMSADYKEAAFRLRPGLKFQDGEPLTAADVKWTYENFKGARAKLFHDKLDHIQIIDDRTIVFHFKQPFLDFMELYNGNVSGIGWIVPRHYYAKVGHKGFVLHPIGAGPYKLESQQPGIQMVFKAWDGYWRRAPATETIIVKGIRDPAARLAGLETGELDLAYGMTGRLLPRVMKDKNLRWDKNFTSAWWLAFPGYQDKTSPFHDKRVREAVSLAINRAFLVREETQGIGIPWGNWISSEQSDALRGNGTGKGLPVPEYNPAKAKHLLAEAGYPQGFDFDWYVPFVPYFDMGQRILADLRAVGIRGKLQVLEGPAFRAKIGAGRKGFPGDRTIVQNIDTRSAAEDIGIYSVCGGPASFVCDPNVEALWKKYQSSLDEEDRLGILASIQRLLIHEYYFVPLYMNPFVHAVGPRVLPPGDGFRHYWDTKNAPYPYPWEVWRVKAGG
jgi:peptide/nickel transport system substrate-binding protein